MKLTLNWLFHLCSSVLDWFAIIPPIWFGCLETILHMRILFKWLYRLVLGCSLRRRWKTPSSHSWLRCRASVASWPEVKGSNTAMPTMAPVLNSRQRRRTDRKPSTSPRSSPMIPATYPRDTCRLWLKSSRPSTRTLPPHRPCSPVSDIPPVSKPNLSSLFGASINQSINGPSNGPPWLNAFLLYSRLHSQSSLPERSGRHLSSLSFGGWRTKECATWSATTFVWHCYEGSHVADWLSLDSPHLGRHEASLAAFYRYWLWLSFSHGSGELYLSWCGKL